MIFRSPACLVGLALALTTSALPRAAHGTPALKPDCQITPVSFEGWAAEQIANKWVRLVIVPQLGGRLMQVSFVGHDFLFVNPKYKGKYIPPSQAGNSWINYGGDKIWPMPEGNEDEHHWVLRSDVLDDGEYKFRAISESPNCKVELDGPPDPVTGLQYSRLIGLTAESPAVTFEAVMKNITSHAITWSVQSVSQYDLASHADPKTFNRNFYAFTPINPHSAYFSEYQVRAGLADDPSFQVSQGLFRLHWLYLENEVWLDSPAGWLAVVDGDSRFAVVEKFKYQPNAAYPGSATVIFYKNGVGLRLDDKSMPQLSSVAEEAAPYYMEAELNSPMVTLNPGETYAFDTQWFPTRSTTGFANAAAAGVVDVPAHLTVEADRTMISGTYGVFYPGELTASYLGPGGLEIGKATLAHADPSELLELHAQISIPRGTTKITLHLISNQGVDRGLLDETEFKASGASV